MNQGLHRLVFDHRRGMAVAVAEGCACQGKAGRTHRRAVVAAAASALLASTTVLPTGPAGAQTRAPVTFARSLPPPAQPLPQPYGTLRGADGRLFNDPALRNFVANPEHRGRVNWSVSADGKTGTFNQGDVDRVILNWDRFDIGAGHRVEFIQNPDPSRYVSALNRIWSSDPSVILGTLKANREVILVNANGVYFGRGARVDTGKFVATSLSIADAVFERGLRNVLDGSAVFSTSGTDYLPTVLDSAISVEAGAEIRSRPGGDVLLIAPRVVNQGRIETPQGQAVLAAGDRVYLMSSSDPAQRGLIVAVDPVKLAGSSTVNDPTLGIVENAAQGSYPTVGGTTVEDTAPAGTAGVVRMLNEIRADSGTVNLVGLLVRQAGQINATTAVKGANRVIQLQAMASTVIPANSTATTARGLVVEDGAQARVSATGGTVEIAAGSVTQVMPSASGDTQLAAEVFNASRLRVEGETITVAGGAQLRAPGGRIELLAASTRTSSSLFNSDAGFQLTADNSRVVIAPGAVLSAAGARDVPVDGSRYQGAQRLFRIELADSPVQRDGPLYRQELRFDTRGAASINVANVAGAGAGTGFSAAEKSTAGGRLRIASEGSVVVGQDATLDVSGGSIRVSDAILENSLLTRDGAVVLFRDARAGTRYDELLDETRKTPLPAYEEGADGGRLELFGRRLALDSAGVGRVVQGERQRDGTASAARPASLRVGFLRQGGQYLAGLALLPTRAPSIDPGVFENPALADLSGLAATTAMSLAQVSEGGFGSLVLRAGTITQPAFGVLDLGVGGQLDMAARTLALDGVFTVPGGTVNLLTNEAGADSAITGRGDIKLSGRTRLDAAGLWTNDTLAGGATGQAPLQLAGGTVAVVAAHDLLAEPGLDIDVSGGARLSGSGSLSRGRAGAINLGSGRSDLFRTRMQIAGVRLSAFDFGSGGTLSIASPGLWLGPAGASAPAQHQHQRLWRRRRGRRHRTAAHAELVAAVAGASAHAQRPHARRRRGRVARGRVAGRPPAGEPELGGRAAAQPRAWRGRPGRTAGGGARSPHRTRGHQHLDAGRHGPDSHRHRRQQPGRRHADRAGRHDPAEPERVARRAVRARGAGGSERLCRRPEHLDRRCGRAVGGRHRRAARRPLRGRLLDLRGAQRGHVRTHGWLGARWRPHRHRQPARLCGAGARLAAEPRRRRGRRVPARCGSAADAGPAARAPEYHQPRRRGAGRAGLGRRAQERRGPGPHQRRQLRAVAGRRWRLQHHLGNAVSEPAARAADRRLRPGMAGRQRAAR
jgi:filamentous hemagglutinin family protein